MRLRLILIVSAFFSLGAYFATLWLMPPSGSPHVGVVIGSKARVGGAFVLTDHTGKRVRDTDFRGRHMLVFFGYTACPDICPMGLQTIGAALEQLGSRADKIAPIFITLDPARDTPDVMASYVANFDPRLIGLTGTPEEIAGVAKAFHAYYSPRAESSDDGKHHVDHAAIYYLQDEAGEYAGHFAYSLNPEELASGIAKLL